MKAKVNFYWEGKLIEAGSEAPKNAPKSLCTTEKVAKKKVSVKTSTKDGRPKNLEDKAKKPVKRAASKTKK